MDLEFSSLQMENIMKDFISKIKSMGMEFSIGLMAKGMKDGG